MSDPSAMRSTLLLRLAGPLQSWGTSSRYTERDTGYEPSKSGVTGILAAAQGRARTEGLSDLAELKIGVRVDQEGVPGYDFQTAGGGEDSPGIAQAMDKQRTVQKRLEGVRQGVVVNKGAVSISRRHFLQDAVFLVGLEGDDVAFLQTLDAALRAPIFPIGLGRRGYVPSVPVALPGSGVREGIALEDALKDEPWPVADLSWRAMRQAERQQPPCRLILEADESNGTATRNDQPIGAAFATRVFGPRPIRFAHVTPPMKKEPADARS